MATYTKKKLSGSTNGRPVKVAATATPGTLIHTATNTGSELDEVWLFAANTSVSSVKLTIEFGGTTSPDDLIELTVLPESGLVLVIPGLILDGGVVVRAFAASADVLTITGFVNNVA